MQNTIYENLYQTSYGTSLQSSQLEAQKSNTNGKTLPETPKLIPAQPLPTPPMAISPSDHPPKADLEDPTPSHEQLRHHLTEPLLSTLSKAETGSSASKTPSSPSNEHQEEKDNRIQGDLSPDPMKDVGNTEPQGEPQAFQITTDDPDDVNLFQSYTSNIPPIDQNPTSNRPSTQPLNQPIQDQPPIPPPRQKHKGKESAQTKPCTIKNLKTNLIALY